MVLFLVSGEGDVVRAVDGLRRAGKRVHHGDGVADSAAAVLKAGRKYIVVAHGSAAGTVRFFKPSRGSAEPWLWVKMPEPPKGTRLYLYCCRAGRRLPRFLKHCESFGHVDVVPMPTGEHDDFVIDFLHEAESLMKRRTFDRSAWLKHLLGYVDERYVDEVEFPGESLLLGPQLLMLRTSLGA